MGANVPKYDERGTTVTDVRFGDLNYGILIEN
jgi:hypothetical protein